MAGLETALRGEPLTELFALLAEVGRAARQPHPETEAVADGTDPQEHPNCGEPEIEVAE